MWDEAADWVSVLQGRASSHQLREERLCFLLRKKARRKRVVWATMKEAWFMVTERARGGQVISSQNSVALDDGTQGYWKKNVRDCKGSPTDLSQRRSPGALEAKREEEMLPLLLLIGVTQQDLWDPGWNKNESSRGPSWGVKGTALPRSSQTPQTPKHLSKNMAVAQERHLLWELPEVPRPEEFIHSLQKWFIHSAGEQSSLICRHSNPRESHQSSWASYEGMVSLRAPETQ